MAKGLKYHIKHKGGLLYHMPENFRTSTMQKQLQLSHIYSNMEISLTAFRISTTLDSIIASVEFL